MQEDDTEKTHVPRRMKWLLIGSLALNLAIVGLLAGAFLRHDGSAHRDARGPGGTAFGQPYLRALPDKARREIFRIVRASEEVPDRAARRARYDDVIAELRADPFDPAALEKTVSEQAAGSVAVQRVAQNAWLQIVSDMSVPERAQYADAVAENLRHARKDR